MPKNFVRTLLFSVLALVITAGMAVAQGGQVTLGVTSTSFAD